MLILLVFLPAGCTNAEGTPPSPAQTSQPSGTQPPAESPGETEPTFKPVETKQPYYLLKQCVLGGFRAGRGRVFQCLAS